MRFSADIYLGSMYTREAEFSTLVSFVAIVGLVQDVRFVLLLITVGLALPTADPRP